MNSDGFASSSGNKKCCNSLDLLWKNYSIDSLEAIYLTYSEKKVLKLT